MKHFNALKQTLLCLAAIVGFGTQSFAALNGSYTIGPGVSDNYPDLSSAVADLNLNGVSGAVNFLIQPGAYTGTGWQAMITSYPGMGSGSPVTFKPANGIKGSVTISYAGTVSADYVLGFNNASYVRVFDLTFINTSTSAATVISFMGSASYDSLARNTFTAASVSSSSNAHAVVSFGVASTYTGTNVSFKTDTLNNGSSSFYLNGVGGSPITNVLLDGNYCTGPYTYGLYSYYAVNLVATNNQFTSSSTGFNTAIYTGYASGGLNILNNTATISTTSPNVTGMYNTNINQPSATIAALISGNNISMTTTSGRSTTLYNLSCTNMTMTNNTIKAITTSSGSAYPPTIAYNGSNLLISGNTFLMQCGSSGSIESGVDWFMVYNSSSSTAMNIMIRENNFNYVTAGGTIGHTGSSYSSSCFMYYPNTVSMIKNNFNLTATASVTAYGLGGGYYGIWYGNTCNIDSNNFNITGTGGSIFGGLCYYYNFYQGTNNSFSYNTMVDNTTTASTYSMYYVSLYETNFKYVGNTSTVTTTSGSIYNPYYMPYYTYGGNFSDNTYLSNSTSNSTVYSPYYFSYYAQTGSVFNNNKFTSTGGTVASPYYFAMYGSGATFSNNTFNITANNGGTVYAADYFMYSQSTSNTFNNTWNVNATSSSSIYAPYYTLYSCSGRQYNNKWNVTGNNAYLYCNYYMGYSATSDTFENNQFNWTTTGSGSIMNYGYYPNALFRNNAFNMNTQSGYIQFQLYYPVAGNFLNNTINANTTSGTIYGLYGYNYSGSGYQGLNVSYNKFNLKSTSGGTIYTYFNSGYDGGMTLTNNLFNSSTTGTSYGIYDPYGFVYDQAFYNNTFYSNSPNTNYMVYKSGTSYPAKLILYNNIFARGAGSNTVPVYFSDTSRVVSDYNLWYSQTPFSFQNASGPSVTTNVLQTWRSNTKRDMNSLIYDPGFTNPGSGDFHPAAGNPNSWAANGRGMLIAGDTFDLDGNVRPKTRAQGVNDLGAYQFTPTSTPPACVATPATPPSGGNQYFTFGGDTAAVIKWGSAVPSSSTLLQYTGQQAGAPMPGLVGRSYLWLDLNTGGTNYAYSHTPVIYYKDDQLGNISTEANAKFANRVPGSIWIGYNFGNSIIDPVMNYSYKATPLDSTGSYTIVENARIGIRCVVEPTGLQAQNITATSVDLKWDPVFLPIGYQVIVDNIPGTPTSGAGALFTSTNTISVATLVEGTNYYAHVRTICGAKDTSGWTTILFRTLITCHAPVVKVSQLTTTRAVIYWDTVETATRYEYVVQNEPTPEPTFGTVTTKNTMIIPIEAGKPYYVFVRAFCNSIYPQSDWGMGSFIKFPTSVSTISGNGIGLSAYPNPVTDVLHVELGNKIDGDASLTVVDITGKVVRTLAVTANTFDVNMAGLPSGVYQLKYSDRSHADVMKISKQ